MYPNLRILFTRCMNTKQPHLENPAEGVVTCGQTPHLHRPLPGQLWVFSSCLHDAPGLCYFPFFKSVPQTVYTSGLEKNLDSLLLGAMNETPDSFGQLKIQESLEKTLMKWKFARFRVYQKDRESMPRGLIETVWNKDCQVFSSTSFKEVPFYSKTYLLMKLPWGMALPLVHRWNNWRQKDKDNPLMASHHDIDNDLLSGTEKMLI